MQAFRLGTRTVDLAAGRVEGGSVPVDLTPTEVRLLRFLAERPGEAVPREELLVRVWGYVPTVRTRTIDTTTSRLRPKLEDDPAEPRFLHTLYGRGVRLDHVEPVESEAPALATRFVGRRDLMDALVASVKRSRLTTVWGPAGAGKSRVVAEVLPRLSGAVQVGCGEVRDGRDLDLAVADALEITSGADLSRALSGGPAVLVLDGCDDAVDAVVERVSRWLAGARRLHVVATSRVELRVPGEQLIAVGPLALDEAAALFVDRARLREPGFDAPTDRIRRLVDRVDRLPLAIEIAAAQVHLVGVDAMLAAPLDAAPLAELIDRSLAQSTADERAALVSAGVLEGPFDLDDFAAVTGLPGGRALRVLDGLVSRSLVWVRDGRHRLYAAVRDRVRRDLDPADPAYERHARWFARLGASEWIARAGSDPSARLALWRATADLRTALRTAPFDGAAGIALLWCCARQGRVAEGLAHARRLDGRSWTAQERLVIGTLAASLSSAAGDERGALAAYQALASVASTAEEHVRVRCAAATSLGRLGDPAGARAELAAVAPHAAHAVNRAQYLGTLAFHTDPPDDEPRMREALAVARAEGARLVELECLGTLGWIAHARHADWDEGRRTFQRLLDACGTDDALVRHRMRAYVGLGELERCRGDLEAAEGWLEQAATLADRHGVTDLGNRGRIELARTWSQAGRHEDALALAEPIAAAARPPPHLATARALLAVAEMRERMGEVDAARRLLAQVLAHAGAVRGELAADALDLLAIVDGDPARLDAADAVDDRPVARVRRRALRAILADRAGDAAAAEVLRIAVATDLARMGLLPDSDPAHWLARATAER